MADNLAMWSGLVGTLLPAIVAKINRADMSPEEKAAVAVLTSLAAAFGTAWFGGNIDPQNLITSFLIVFTTATVTYKTFWSPSGYATRLERGPGDIRSKTGY